MRTHSVVHIDLIHRRVPKPARSGRLPTGIFTITAVPRLAVAKVGSWRLNEFEAVVR